MNLRLATILFFSVSLLSCSEGTSDFEKQYIDLRSLIEDTISSNSKLRPTFYKEVKIDGESEDISTQEIEWSKELEVFLSMDLNKRDYLNKYKIDSTAFLLNYTLLPEMEAPVKEIKISFDSTSSSINIVEAFLKTNNFLYDSERHMTMYFDAGELVQYEVSGWQQLFIGGKKSYNINAKKRGA